MIVASFTVQYLLIWGQCPGDEAWTPPQRERLSTFPPARPQLGPDLCFAPGSRHLLVRCEQTKANSDPDARDSGPHGGQPAPGVKGRDPAASARAARAERS